MRTTQKMPRLTIAQRNQKIGILISGTSNRQVAKFSPKSKVHNYSIMVQMLKKTKSTPNPENLGVGSTFS